MAGSRYFFAVLAGWAVVLLSSSSPAAFEINPEMTLEGDLAAVFQYQNLSDAPQVDDSGRGAVVFQPTLGLRLSDKDHIKARFGFAAGNALNDTAPFAHAPWAADMEADVKGINGRDRDYLLAAWYEHIFGMGDQGALTVSGGIIDATLYLDQNAYANDEFTQFLNSALVNAPHAFLPAYDPGAAAQWESGSWSAAAVYMSIGKNENEQGFNFFGAQLAYRLQLAAGEGNYRLNVNATSSDFSSPAGEARQSKRALLLSCDQQLGGALGAWVRLGWQDDDAAIAYQRLFSGGIDIGGKRWAREKDNIGLGFAYLDHGNLDLRRSHVLELYYRSAITDFAALTVDFQYLIEDYRSGEDPRGWVGGVRWTLSF